MGNIQCNNNKFYSTSTQSCLSNCINNTTSMVSDPFSCVSVINCPSGTTQDPVFDNVCNKVAVAPTAGACPSGYSLWTPSTCYVDCSPSFQETGITCLKKTVSRISETPNCGTIFYSFVNGQCNLNYFVVFIGAFLGLLLIVIISKMDQSSFLVLNSNSKKTK